MPRKVTCNVIEAVEDGFLTYEDVAKAALSYLSEDEVKDMARMNDWYLPTLDDDLEYD